MVDNVIDEGVLAPAHDVVVLSAIVEVHLSSEIIVVVSDLGVVAEFWLLEFGQFHGIAEVLFLAVLDSELDAVVGL